jgi:hypothetical protein
MPSPIYQFDDKTPASVSLNDLARLPYGTVLKHLERSLRDLISGRQQDKLDKSGYVISLDGPYGAGKTTAANALIHDLDSHFSEKLLHIERSFLPFSNPSEAIASFLGEMAEQLWRRGFTDVRNEIQQFILEVTPAPQHISAGLNIGPLNLTWPLKRGILDGTNSSDSIADKLSKVASAGKTIMITIDDLDRLEPEQIVALMRMVERLRALPRIIIILPMYKKIVTQAFVKQFNINASEGPALLRKLIDYEVKISNQQQDMKRVFVDTLNRSGVSTVSYYASWVTDLCWHILLHNIVIAEAASLVEQEENGGAEKVAIIRRSPYLARLQDMFNAQLADNRDVEPYMTLYTGGARNRFQPIGYQYQALHDMGDKILAPRQLAEMRNVNNVMMKVTTDQKLVEDFHNGAPAPLFDPSIEAASHDIALTNLFIPMLLAGSEPEPLLTENYKLRDMAILARRIRGNRKFSASIDNMEELYKIIKQEFDDFR